VFEPSTSWGVRFLLAQSYMKSFMLNIGILFFFKMTLSYLEMLSLVPTIMVVVYNGPFGLILIENVSC
jgi:hypothetical protein